MDKKKTWLEKKNIFAGEIDLTTGNLFQKMLIFTGPIILLSVFQLLYSSMDGYVVSQFGAGYTSFDAIGSNNALINLLIGLFVGTAVGANVVVAKAFGAGDREKAHRAIESSMVLACIFGVVVALIGYFMSPYFLIWMQTPAEYIDEATVYLQLYFIGMPFLMIFNFGAAILRGMGDSQRPLYALVACAVLNVALNFAFVLGFHMQSDGQDVFAVGLTTIISQAVEAILTVIFLLGKKNSFARFSFKDFKLYPDETKEVLRNGIPAGLQSLVFSLSNVFIQTGVNSFSTDTISPAVAVAGNTASITIEGYIYIVLNAFSTAVVAIVAQNYGAGNKENIKKALWLSLSCTVALGLLLGGLATLLRRQLCGIFITPDSFDNPADYEQALEIGGERLTLIGLTYFLDGIMDNTSAYCRGLGHAKTPTIITFFACTVMRIVFISTAWQMVPFFHTLPWLWSTWPISWVLAVAAYYCFVPGYIKKAFAEIDARPAAKKNLDIVQKQ
jgi:putative MATE family efflux protein